jgi:peptidoglycan/LPS O-acetylase OafA/YrhL
MEYRKEIDGLRALAVLPVILFHAGLPWAAGGFVGVDVFFVISGYLITSIILKEQSEGRFTISGFYERRIRRIMPALLLVILTTLPFALYWLLPDQLQDFSRSVLSVIFFISNLYFRRDTGYFSGIAEEKPLLHTWSLSLEEQFYLLFPLFVFSLRRYRRRWLVAALFLFAVASLAFAEWQSTRRLDSSFFDTRARIWELLSGSLLACLTLSGRAKNIPRLLAETCALAGLLMIGGAIAFFSRATPFPSIYGLIPVFGTGFIILFATRRTFVGQLLGSRPFVMVGLVSYSAYLWHQPLFAFARVRSMDSPSSFSMFGLAALTLVLAYGSWRFVEQPCRNRRILSSRTLFVATAATCLLLVCTGFVIRLSGGLKQRYGESDLDLLLPIAKHAEYVAKYHATLIPLGPEKTPGFKRLLVVGDSYSQDMVNAFREVGAFPEFDTRVVYVPAQCQVYIGQEDVSSFRPVKDRALSGKDSVDIIQQHAQQADVVILASSWRAWAADRLPETLKNICVRPDTRLFVVGRKSFGRINRGTYVEMSIAEKAGVRRMPSSEHLVVNNGMRQNLPPEVFVDLHALICGDGAVTSPAFTPEGKLISYDGSHLTREGAKFVGQRLMNHPLLRPYRAH